MLDEHPAFDPPDVDEDPAGVVRKACWNNLVGPAITGEVVSLSGLTNDLGETLPGLSLTWTAGTTGGSYTGSLTYTAPGSGSGADNLSITINDGRGGLSSTTTVISIAPSARTVCQSTPPPDSAPRKSSGIT